MVITLPTYFNEKTMYDFISNIESNLQNKELIFDFSKIDFVTPSGVTILCNIIEWLRKKNIIVSHKKNHQEIQDIKDGLFFLDDSRFFESFFGKKLFQKSELRNTTIPVKNITCERYYSWIKNEFIPWLSNCTGVYNEKYFSGIETSIGEIFNNIKDHSTENIGCVFAQFYPNIKKLEIAISDFGVGIASKIKGKIEEYRRSDDRDVLVKAIEEGFTTTSVPNNRGAGLDTLIKYVVFSKNGKISIFSNKGALKISKNNNGEQILIFPEIQGFYPGTLILITFTNTDSIYDELEEEDCNWS